LLDACNQIGLNQRARRNGFEKEPTAPLLFHLGEELLEELLMLWSMGEQPCSSRQMDRPSLLQTPPDQHAQTRWRGWRLGKENKPPVRHAGFPVLLVELLIMPLSDRTFVSTYYETSVAYQNIDETALFGKSSVT
jgi:hypothetical protein